MKVWMLWACNIALYLSTCLLAATGLALELRLDEGEAASLWGVGRDEWGEIHLLLALAFLVLSVVHVAINWSWIKGLLRGPRRWSVLAAGGLGMVLAAAILLAPEGGNGGRHGAQPGQLRESHDD